MSTPPAISPDMAMQVVGLALRAVGVQYPDRPDAPADLPDRVRAAQISGLAPRPRLTPPEGPAVAIAVDGPYAGEVAFVLGRAVYAFGERREPRWRPDEMPARLLLAGARLTPGATATEATLTLATGATATITATAVPRYERAMFTLELLEGSVAGWDGGDVCSAGVCPLFELDAVREIAHRQAAWTEAHADLEFYDERVEVTGDGPNAVVTMHPYEDDPYTLATETIDTPDGLKVVWGVGYGSWSWSYQTPAEC